MASTQGLVDTHIHLDFEGFDEDRDAVVDRARAAGIGRIVNPGIDVDSSRRAIALAARYPGIVYAAAGIHPMCASGDVEATLAAIRPLLGAPGVVAVGEGGLDLFKKYHPFPAQRAFFVAQVALAKEVGLPLIIHCRDAFAETLAVLDEIGTDGLTAVMHCFGGGAKDAVPFVERGLYVGFCNNITYPKAANLREAAREIPLSHLVVETDGPYLAPQKHRGERNESAYVVHAAAQIAIERGLTLAAVAEATTRNAERLFRFRDADARSETPDSQ